VSSGGSIPFDRAAEVYDETRGLTAEASAATTDLLRRELEARQPCLEIGVGTGLIGLPLHRAAIRMIGVDLSAPMLGKLVEKAEGRLPFRWSSGMRPGCPSPTTSSAPRSPGTCSISSLSGGTR
jgi:ubiquinone/menaquinone biosynthesis C-methylase UbiE